MLGKEIIPSKLLKGVKVMRICYTEEYMSLFFHGNCFEPKSIQVSSW
jgi:hypothetical protein